MKQHLIIGRDGLLGSALMGRLLGNGIGTTRRMSSPGPHYDLLWENADALPRADVAYLCAGTKGYRECEGNRDAFHADVDGNLRAIKMLLARGTFVVFVSTDAVCWGAHTAYARNRLIVETAITLQPRVAIMRPAKFDQRTAGDLADHCLLVGGQELEGVHYWSPNG